MILKINATQMVVVPFTEGLSELENFNRLFISIFIKGSSHEKSQIKDFLLGDPDTVGFEWLRPSGQQWCIDADLLCLSHGELTRIPWLRGKLIVDYSIRFGILPGPMSTPDSSGRELIVMGNHPMTAIVFNIDAAVALAKET